MAAALRLKARGYRVQLFDKLPFAGGRAQVYRHDGYVFDAGPTVVTAPFLFEELFELFGRKLSDYVELLPVEPWYQFLFSDGEKFDYGGTVADTIREIERLSPGDGKGYEALVAESKKIFKVGFEELADQPFHSFFFMLRQVPQLLRLRGYLTVYRFVKRYLKDSRLQQAFSIQPLLVGGNPCSTTCIYSMIHFLERRWGIHFPRGGTGALVEGLHHLLKDVGVEMRLGESVEKIVVRGRRAHGVVTGQGEVVAADIVVCNGDPPAFYKHLIGAEYRHKWTDMRIDKLHYSMGLFVIYFGTKRTYPDVEHHTIIMGERFTGLLDDIFKHQRLAEDFSLYLHRPTATDPSMAPDGHDCFYVLSPVPNLQGNVDWAAEGERYKEKILEALENSLLPGLRESITVDFFKTPKDFQTDYRTVHGTGFSIAPIFTQSGWFRFHNKSEDVEDLYFVGAGTHPGAGLPGVLSSAKVLERVIAGPHKRQEQVLQRYGKSFYLAGRFLPESTRRGATLLYSFCRGVDDLADGLEETSMKLQKLHQLKAQLTERSSESLLAAQFLALQREFPVSEVWALELIQGAIDDQRDCDFQSVRDLVEYCFRVAGTVGLMLCPILGVQDSEAEVNALDLGIAMQLTNICRDILEDAESGRVYLPAELTGGRLDPADLASRNPEVLVRAELGARILLELAEVYYRSAEAGLRFIPLENRLGILIALQLYREKGRVLAGRSSSEFFQSRAGVSTLRNLYLAGRSLCALGSYSRPKKGTAKNLSCSRPPGLA
jgi:phytoene desaturase